MTKGYQALQGAQEKKSRVRGRVWLSSPWRAELWDRGVERRGG